MVSARRPPRIIVTLLAAALAPGEAPAHAQPPALAPPPPTTQLADGTLEPDGGGRLRYRGEGFTAIVHPDGSVEFRDHGGTAEVNLFGLDPLRRRILDPAPDRHDPAWTALLERTFFPGGRLPIMSSVGGRFGGLADGPRKDRHMGAKRAFMASTEALRLRMANHWYKERLRSELAELGGQLTAVWRDTRLPLAERKRRIFERWADCEDPSTAARSELDAVRLAGARSARAKIEAFVRQVAPHRSPRAYTRSELDRFNRGRAGKPHFRPYDAPAPSPEPLADSEPGAAVDAPLPSNSPPPTTPPPAPPFGPDPGPGWLRPTRSGAI